MNLDLPVSRMDSPESNGSERIFRLAAGTTATSHLDINGNAGSRPLDTDAPKLKALHTLMFSGQFAVLNKLDLGIRTTFGYAPVLATAKFQVFGEPAATAKAGNFSLAVSTALGYWQHKSSGEQQYQFGPGGFPWSSEVRMRSLDAGVIIGYRTAEKFLLYGGGFYTNYDVDVNIDQARSDDGTQAAATYSLDTNGYQKGANLGGVVSFNDVFHLMGELVYSDVHFSPGVYHPVRSVALNSVFTF